MQATLQTCLSLGEPFSAALAALPIQVTHFSLPKLHNCWRCLIPIIAHQHMCPPDLCPLSGDWGKKRAGCSVARPRAIPCEDMLYIGAKHL